MDDGRSTADDLTRPVLGTRAADRETARSIYAAAGPLNVSMTRALARAGSPRDLRAPQR